MCCRYDDDNNFIPLQTSKALVFEGVRVSRSIDSICKRIEY